MGCRILQEEASFRVNEHLNLFGRPWKCKKRRVKKIRNFGDNSKILKAVVDVDSKAIRLVTETSFASLYYDDKARRSQKKERHHPRQDNQRTLFYDILQTDEQVSCSEFYCGKLVIATHETGRVSAVRGDFPRIRRQIQDMLPPSDLHNARLQHKWSCMDLWCHQEFLLVVQRDHDTRLTLINNFKVCLQETVPEVIAWCMTRSGHVWYSSPNGSIHCLQNKRSFSNQRQVVHMFPVLLEQGREGLIIIDSDNAVLIDCTSFKELARVLLPDHSHIQVFCRHHSVDNQILIISVQLSGKDQVLYRLVVHKGVLLLDEYNILVFFRIIESRMECGGGYLDVFVSSIVIVALW